MLKLDCEGAEYKILFGCSQDSLKKVKKISMEYHNLDKKNKWDELKKFLEKNGFVVSLSSENGLMLYTHK